MSRYPSLFKSGKLNVNLHRAAIPIPARFEANRETVRSWANVTLFWEADTNAIAFYDVELDRLAILDYHLNDCTAGGIICRADNNVFDAICTRVSEGDAYVFPREGRTVDFLRLGVQPEMDLNDFIMVAVVDTVFYAKLGQWIALMNREEPHQEKNGNPRGTNY